MNWNDRDKWSFDKVVKCASYYDSRENFEWELPSEEVVVFYLNKRIEMEIQRLRKMLSDNDMRFNSEYQSFLTNLRPLAWKLVFDKVNRKIFSGDSKKS